MNNYNPPQSEGGGGTLDVYALHSILLPYTKSWLQDLPYCTPHDVTVEYLLELSTTCTPTLEQWQWNNLHVAVSLVARRAL